MGRLGSRDHGTSRSSLVGSVGMDPIEKALHELSETCGKSWSQKSPECAACPLGEVAALVAACLVFYREQKKDGGHHWSHAWEKR